MFKCVISKGIGLYYAGMEFNMLAPRSVVKDKPYATNGISTSDYCRFAQVLQSMPPIDVIERDFDLERSSVVNYLMEPTTNSFYTWITLNGVT